MLTSPQRRQLIKETDEKSRKIERSVHSNPGDITNKARLINQQIKQGKLDREKIKLAARLGDKAPLILFPNVEKLDYASNSSEQILSLFTTVGGNIKKFSIDVAKAVLPAFEQVAPYDNRPRLAIEAAVIGKVSLSVATAAYTAGLSIIGSDSDDAYTLANLRAARAAAAVSAHVAYAVRNSFAKGFTGSRSAARAATRNNGVGGYEWQVNHLIELLFV